jgi:hypothetical protein
MKITLFGVGGGEVRGSAYVVESGRSKVLIDCRLFQGIRSGGSLLNVPEFGCRRECLRTRITALAAEDLLGLLAPVKRSNVRLMQVNRRSDSPDAQVNQFHKN